MNRISSSILLFLSIFIYISSAFAKPEGKVYSLETTLLMTQQTEDFYTVQLYASYHVQAARRFAKALTEAQNIVIIAVAQGHRSLYKVIDGQFTSYQLAQRYLTNAGNILREYQPWVTQIKNDFSVIPIQLVNNKKPITHPLHQALQAENFNISKYDNLTSRFYIQGNVSYAFSNRLKDAFLSNSTKNTPLTTAASADKFLGASIGIGYILTPIWRISVEYNYGKTKTTLKGNTLGGQQNDTEKANVTLNTLTANLLFNFNGIKKLNFGNFNPYIGMGLGIGINKEGIVTGTATGYTLSHDFYVNGSTKISFAWQIMLGTQYRLTHDFSLDVGYKYINAGKIQSGTIETDSVSNYLNLTNPQNSNIYISQIYAGIKYQF